MKKFLLIFLSILFCSGLIAGLEVGTNPTTMNIGEIDSGEELEGEILVTLDQVDEDQDVDIELSVIDYEESVFTMDSFEDEFDRISEQRTTEWWSFEVQEMDPNATIQRQGTNREFQGLIEYSLDVSPDAEPGIHRGQIRVDPETDGEADGMTSLRTGTTIPFSFIVDGSPQRDIVAQDVRGFRTDEDRASVEVLLQNTGTVTASTEDSEVVVRDEAGNELVSENISSTALEPGESEWVNANWQSDDMDEGTYHVEGELNYFTGSAYASGSFSLSDIVEVVPEDSPESDVDDSDDSLPIWLVLMILTILGVLMWSFEIDPVWIFGIIGIFGISAFVLMSNVSNLLLVGVLIPALLIVYLGV